MRSPTLGPGLVIADFSFEEGLGLDLFGQFVRAIAHRLCC